MSHTKTSAGDTVFTIVAALAAIVAALIAITIGSAVARVTFTPHEGHSEAGAEAH